MTSTSKNNLPISLHNARSAQDDIAHLDCLVGDDIDEDVLFDSCPAGQPTEGSRYEISKHLNNAIEARKLAIERGRLLKQDWLDAEHWRELAAKRNYRLPDWYIPLSKSGLEKVLHELNVNQNFFRECYGDRLTYQEFVNLNPRVPLWVFAGWILELLVQ